MGAPEGRGILERLDLFLEDLLIGKMTEVDVSVWGNRRRYRHLVSLVARRSCLDSDL